MYSYLPPSTRLKCTIDVEMQRECVCYGLSENLLPKKHYNGLNQTKPVKENTNTQKVEVSLRAYSLRNLKNITFSRNFYGRIHNTSLAVNRGTGEAIVMKAEDVGVPIVPGSPAAHQLYTIQKSGMDLKKYKKIEQYKQRRCKSRFAKDRLYDAKNTVLTYESGLLDSESCKSKRKKISNVPSRYVYSYCKL